MDESIGPEFSILMVHRVYLLSRGAKQRNGTTGSDIVKTDEKKSFDGARIGAAFVRGG